MRGVESVRNDDLPDRFGAMLVKELRQNMRRGSFVYPFLGIQVLAVLALLVEFQNSSAKISEPSILRLSCRRKSGGMLFIPSS